MSLSMLLGIGFQSFLAQHLGTGTEADIFYLGTVVPTIVATIIIGSIPNALIALAVSQPNSLRAAWESKALRQLMAIVAVPSVTFLLAGIALLNHVGSPFDARTTEGVGDFLVITSPVPLLALLAALGAVRSLAAHNFVIGTYGSAANGLGLLTATLLVYRTFGHLDARHLAAAVDIGYLFQLGLVWRPLRRKVRSESDEQSVRNQSAARSATLAFLMLAGASVLFKSQPLIERIAGAILGSGVPAALGYAEKLTLGLTQVAVFGFSIAALPMISRDLFDREHGRARNRLRFALLGTFASATAVVGFGAACSGTLVRLFYEHGAFSSHAAYMTERLILWSLPSVAFSALSGPLTSVWYADGRIREVVTIGLVGFIVGSAATFILSSTLGFDGIVIGTAIGYALTFLLFAARLSLVLPSWSWFSLLRETYPTLLAIVALVLIGSGLLGLVVRRIDLPRLPTLFVLGCGMLILLGCSFVALFSISRHRSPAT